MSVFIEYNLCKNSGFCQNIFLLASSNHQPNIFIMLIVGLNVYDKVDSHLDAKPYSYLQSWWIVNLAYLAFTSMLII